MEGALKGLFGGGATTDTAPAHDFVQRVTTGNPAEGYTTEEAHNAAAQVLQNASPDTINRAMQQSLGNLNDDQRSEFAKMLQQRAAEGRPADPSSGLTVQHSSDPSQPAADSGGGGLGDILGGLLGGGGGLGGLLGGLLGGGGQTQSQSQPQVQSQAQAQTGGQTQMQPDSSGQGGVMGGLGDLMNNPIGKMVMAGMAAYAMKEVLNR